MQHRLALIVAESHPVEVHLALHRGHRHRVGILVGLGRRIDDLENPLGPGKGPGHPRIDFGKPLHRPVDQPHIGVDCQQGADTQFVAEDFGTTEIPDDEYAESRNQAHGRPQRHPVAGSAARDHGQVFVVLLESRQLARLLSARLDHADPVQRLVEPGSQLRPAAAVLVEHLAHPPPEQDAPEQRQRHRDQHQQRDLPAHRKQKADDSDDHQALYNQIGQAIDEKILHHLGIARHPRDQPSGRTLVVKLQREHFEAAIELGADIGRHPRTEPRHHPVVDQFRPPAPDSYPDKRQDQKTQQIVAVGKAQIAADCRHQHVVDQVLGHQRRHQLGDGGSDRGHGQYRRPPLVGGHKGGNAL